MTVALEARCCNALPVPSLLRPAVAPGSLARSAQPVLANGPLTLRPWATRDIPELVAAYAEPEIQQWHARSMSPDEASGWIAEADDAWLSETAASWAVEADGMLASRMTLRFHLSDGFADAAYWTRRTFRGRGVASRALQAATQWAFSIGMHRVELEHSTRNPSSCRVALKAGFAPEGTRREGALHVDGWHDMHTHSKISAGSMGDLG